MMAGFRVMAKHQVVDERLGQLCLGVFMARADFRSAFVSGNPYDVRKVLFRYNGVDYDFPRLEAMGEYLITRGFYTRIEDRSPEVQTRCKQIYSLPQVDNEALLPELEKLSFWPDAWWKRSRLLKARDEVLYGPSSSFKKPDALKSEALLLN